MQIRSERPSDIPAVRAVNLAAFATQAEADLVNALRERATPIVSLVADEGTSIVGHILFSPVTLTSHPDPRIFGLAPMAVMPARQRQGVGSALVRDGLDQCRHLGFGAVVVLGHAGFYPRFGFAPASRFGISCEYDVPDDVFMAIELEPASLTGLSGRVRYHPAFANV